MLRSLLLSTVRLPAAAAAAALLAAAAPHAALAQDVAAPAPAVRSDASAPVRWEHAELRMELSGGHFSWTTRDGILAGDDLKKFARRLGAPGLAEGVYTDVRMLDHFAEQGWELVQCEIREEHVGLLSGETDVRRCLFRRPRREAPPA